MKKEIHSIIDDFKNLKILVAGDAILDTYEYGTIDRICREAPVPVFNSLTLKHSCGGAANTAINVSALGGKTYFLTALGNDANGKEIMDILRDKGVNTEYILKEKTRKTVSKKRVVASSNIILRIDEGSTNALDPALEKQLLGELFKIYDSVDAVLLSDYNFGLISDTFIRALAMLSPNKRKPIIVDSKHPGRFKDLHPTIVKPNYTETLNLLKIPKVAQHKRVQQITENTDSILNKTGAAYVAVTLDTDGVLLLKHGRKPYRIPSQPKDAKNTIGAGDSFVSALALGVASKIKMETAAEIAAAAAAIVVEKEGTTGCTNNELKAYFNPVRKFINNTEDLAATVDELKKNGKKIVFTNGCFDLIHKGHISLLNKARQAGDVLIVGVNTDESTRKVKGPDRPINSLADRITVLSGLQSIDYLISFEEESPVELIKIIHPDIFIKGAHYTENSIPEAPLLKKMGCQVKIIPTTEDISTTELINKINEINDETTTKEPFKKRGKLQAAAKVFS